MYSLVEKQRTDQQRVIQVDSVGITGTTTNKVTVLGEHIGRDEGKQGTYLAIFNNGGFNVKS